MAIFSATALTPSLHTLLARLPSTRLKNERTDNMSHAAWETNTGPQGPRGSKMSELKKLKSKIAKSNRLLDRARRHLVALLCGAQLSDWHAWGDCYICGPLQVSPAGRVALRDSHSVSLLDESTLLAERLLEVERYLRRYKDLIASQVLTDQLTTAIDQLSSHKG